MPMGVQLVALLLLAVAGEQAAASPEEGRSGTLHWAPQRLRGGFEAAAPFKPANLGVPNAWSGRNVGPKEKRLNFLHAKARPQAKVQSKWYIDCTRPVGDKLIDMQDMERYMRETLKVQGKTGNLAAGRDADQPRVLVFVDDKCRDSTSRLILQAYIPVAKRYVKHLIKKYLYTRGLRDFVWCVAAGKSSYKLKYYDIQDIRSAATAPSHSEAPVPVGAADSEDAVAMDEEAADRVVEGGSDA